MKRIIPLYNNYLNPSGSHAFTYTPKTKSSKVLGLLIGSNTSVSLSLNGGTHLVFNSQVAAPSTSLAPDSRIFTLNEALRGSNLLGNVKNISTKKNSSKVSAFLIIEE